jgi:hypothetical protein
VTPRSWAAQADAHGIPRHLRNPVRHGRLAGVALTLLLAGCGSPAAPVAHSTQTPTGSAPAATSPAPSASAASPFMAPQTTHNRLYLVSSGAVQLLADRPSTGTMDGAGNVPGIPPYDWSHDPSAGPVGPR